MIKLTTQNASPRLVLTTATKKVSSWISHTDVSLPPKASIMKGKKREKKGFSQTHKQNSDYPAAAHANHYFQHRRYPDSYCIHHLHRCRERHRAVPWKH